MTEDLKDFVKYLMPSGLLFLVNKEKGRSPSEASHTGLHTPFPRDSSETPKAVKLGFYWELRDIKTDMAGDPSTFPMDALEDLLFRATVEQEEYADSLSEIGEEADYSQQAINVLTTYEEIEEDIRGIIDGSLTLEEVIEYYHYELFDEHDWESLQP